MRDFIREIFAGVYAPFTGKFLSSIAILPILFSLSIGVNQTSYISNVVDESAIYESVEVEEKIDTTIEIKEPDAGNIPVQSIEKNETPIDISGNVPVSYELAISGKIATSVTNVGFDSKGAVAVPDSIAGYYSNSDGAHLLVGHNPGVFSGLTSVSVGDVIHFRGNNYRVYGSKVYEYDPDLSVYDSNGNLTINGTMMLDSLYEGGTTGLNLMTCYGSYSQISKTYSHRFVVFADKI